MANPDDSPGAEASPGLSLEWVWPQHLGPVRVGFTVRTQFRPPVRTEATADELGLPVTLEQARKADLPNGQLPSTLAAALRTALAADPAAAGKLLWLSLPTPAGTLALAPWEKLLRAIAPDAPILRFPYLRLHRPPPPSLEIVLCISSPRAKEPFDAPALIRSLCPAILNGAPPDSRVHIFADTQAQPGLAGLGGRLRIYNPERAREFSPPLQAHEPPDQAKAIDNPWLLWMLQELERPVDVCHFVGHGYLTLVQGTLALAESPLSNKDGEWARFVGARQLAAFLDRSGARALCLGAAPLNYSLPALRLLADNIARNRPGPVFLHEASEPAAMAVVTACYRFLGTPSSRPPSAPDASLSCDPDALLSRAPRPSPLFSVTGNVPPVAGWPAVGASSFEVAERVAPPSSWAAFGQRILERQAAELRSQPRTGVPGEGPERAGVEEAIRLVAAMIRRHALSEPGGPHILNLTLPLKQDADSQAKIKDLADQFATVYWPKVRQGLAQSQTNYFARFVLLGAPPRYLQFLTEYDTDFRIYTDSFADNLKDFFAAIFWLVEGAPPPGTPITSEFVYKLVHNFDLPCLGNVWFSAFGDRTVKEIQQKLGEGPVSPAS